ncbi:MAG: serine hydrolase [Gammaproteobacteria bacterium]|jgi:CubicO group peptidase (beta-lactamase class C family)|nr:serine hydrolase [Gammaproteobacteria bacterium]
MTLLNELEFRNVFRVGLFCIVSAWLVFSRVFELTPDGLERDRVSRVDPAIKRATTNRLNGPLPIPAETRILSFRNGERPMSPCRLIDRSAAALLTAGLALAGLTAPVLGADLADDPRVANAVRLWSEWVEYQAGTDRVPGVSWGIVHDQDLIASGAFGQANPSDGIPAGTETLYSICSISKLFTSIALMQQREAGRVRLDDPVAEHLDWFDIEDAHPGDEAITVRRLLTHSAGLPRESDFPYWTDADYPFPSPEALQARLEEQQTLYPASRYFQYSNLGLSLVGEIVSAVSGQSYPDYMREQLLGPLGMDDTYTDIPVELRGDEMAIGYTALDRNGERQVVAPFQTRGIAPAAGFASNVEDLAKFAMWQFHVLDGADRDLLGAASLREMQRVHWIDPDWETTWGLGFSVVREGDRTFARHGGACPGYYTEFRAEPATRIAAIVLTNAIGASPGLYAAKAFDLIGPAIAEAKDSPDELTEPGVDVEPYTGVYGSIWGQSVVVPWKDGLALLGLGSMSPAEDMARLEYVEGHAFRRIREDGDTPGETVRFEMGPDGMARSFVRHSSRAVRIER